MDFVSPIITPIVESLMVPVKKHLGFLVSSKKNVKKMDDKIKQLKDKAKEVEATLEKAVGNTEVVSQLVEPWLEDVKKLNERSDNLNEAIGCFNVAKRYKMGKQSSHILEEITDLENRRSEIVFTHVQIPLAEVGSTSTGPSTSALVPMGTQNDFESRNLVFNNVLQALQSNDESQKMIALCGMGGVGKTTMMEQLKKVIEDSNTFDSVVKVVIGETNDANSLQRAIAQYLTCNDLTESVKDARADRLRKIFEAKSQQGKKILVIMDDLWKEFDLTDVGLSPLPNGFKLLFTSRFDDKCTTMGVRVDSIFKVEVLNQIEASNLFFRTVGPCPSDGDDAEFKRVGEQIVKKCGRLPIAIVTIASALRGYIKVAWEDALYNLQHDDLQDFDGIVHKVFELSYINLKKEDDKAIFLLSGLFPDDFNIPIEDLTMYAWGLELFSEVHTLAHARRRANVCVKNLISANLLTESDVNGHVKMHDLVRAFVLSNFSKVKQASIVNNESKLVHMHKKDAHKSYERILLKCTYMCELPGDFNYSNLSLLILMDGYKLNNVIYERMEKLKVMSYENLNIPLSPVMFEHSIKLRTVRLRSCFLIDNDLSFFGSLHNLEILSLVYCNIRRLPSTIGKLKKLKLLDLRGCIDLRIDDDVIQNLVSLEELYLRAVEGHVRFTHANYEELQKISQSLLVLVLEFIAWTPQKVMSFKKLERFEISIGCHLEKDYSNDYSFKNKLNLVATCNELKACNISDLFERTEELKLEVNGMYYIEDISLNHTFCQLRVFHVSNCANLTSLFTPDVANGLKKLERLTISNCPVLKALVSKSSGVGVITFQKLNVMSLEGVPKMLTLFEGVIKLPELVELRLCGLPNFTSIYHDNNSGMSVMQPLLNKEVIMPKLELLDISSMENLKQIWPCEISSDEKNDVSMLRSIGVRKCDNLVNLFPSNPFPLLNHLEELGVEKCGSIEVLFNIDFEYVTRMREYNSRLRSIKVENLGKINELWRMRGTNNSNIVISGFKGVKSISITDCPKFTNIFTPMTTNFDLGALVTYKTERIGCDVEESYRQKKLLAERDEMIIMTYPSYLLQTCHRLQNLELSNDGRVKEVVFEMDSHQPLLLPCLESLVLNGLEMSHVWKCNWNKFFIHQHQLPFQNLTDIYLLFSPKLKYLFSPLMAIYLPNLKKINIKFCDGIEEVISSRDDENEENTSSASSHQNTTFFPQLDTLELIYLSCLMSIDGGGRRSDANSSNITNTIHDQSQQSGQVIGACWSLCQYPKQIRIEACNALSSLVPWYSVGQMKNLETLFIDSCQRMKEVFESESSRNKLDEVISENGGTTLTTGPTLENITTLVVPQLTNLKDVSIGYCNLLSHVFTFSTLESLNQLKRLRVKECNVIKVIIEKEENIITSSKDVVKLPRLETLELVDLPNLEGSFLGMNEIRWPSLDYVMINNCPKMMRFTSGQSITPKLKYICTGIGKYSLENGLNFHGKINQTTFLASSTDSTVSKGMPWSFHNLIEINICSECNVGRSIIPSNVLLQLEKLEKIDLLECRGVEEVFEVVAAPEGQSGLNESQTTTAVQIPNLKQVNLIIMSHLKYLWKSNRSMVLEFPNLTTLSIKYCQSLEHAFTCSMVGSLVQLQDLHISYCYNIEVIVKEEEESEDKLVMLPRLKSLQLEGLDHLKGFCLGKDAFSLPALDTLTIKKCPKITVFTRGYLSTPNLKVTYTDFGIFAINEDLNSVIETNQQEIQAQKMKKLD